MSIEARYSASFVTFGKPCEEALADLSTAYNELADKIEAEWEKSARLEARIEEVEQMFATAQDVNRDYAGRLENALHHCERLEKALREIIEEFREGKPRGYDGPPTYEEDDPVVAIARAALAEEPYADVPGAGQVGCG